jgi:hypothetical protein
MRISGHVSASVGDVRIVVPGADYYADEMPAPVVGAGGDGSGISDIPPLPVWRLRAMQPQRVPAAVREFDLTGAELSHYVVGGEITILDELCP